MLRTWVKDKQKILNQKKGSRRAREPWEKGQEDQMEIELKASPFPTHHFAKDTHYFAK
jgi:hypothetical protein